MALQQIMSKIEDAARRLDNNPEDEGARAVFEQAQTGVRAAVKDVEKAMHGYLDQPRLEQSQ